MEKHKRNRIGFFGHFGKGNFGNEGTLQAILYHLRLLLPDAEITCICTGPDAVASDYHIATIDLNGPALRAWPFRDPVSRIVRKLLVGVPSEIYRWFVSFMAVRKLDVLIIPGTGLLTDAYSLTGWGPYSTFKWSVIAKLCRRKLLFVSVGAGPLYSPLGRFFVKTSLFLADFRSYRDNSTVEYLKKIGFRTDRDQIYPDLAFSLPRAMLAIDNRDKARRTVVGLGLMEYAGKYSIENPTNAIYRSYLDNLVVFVRWLIARDCDVRLLIGDVYDRAVTREFSTLLKSQLTPDDECRVVEEPVDSVQNLLSQIAATDVVVATRFHNVLFALLLNKPVLSISFHHKCSSLMSGMGLSEYCQDINDLKADRLIDQFCELEKNAERLKVKIRQKATAYRQALDSQYANVFRGRESSSEQTVPEYSQESR